MPTKPKIVELDPTNRSIVPTEEEQINNIKDQFAKSNKPLSKYKPEFKLITIELAATGHGPVEIAKALGVSETTLYNWAHDKDEFKECFKIARDLYRAWWERLGREAAKGHIKGFNPYTYAFQMKNRFPDDWSESTKVTQRQESAPIDIDPNAKQLGHIKGLLERKEKKAG